MEAVAQDFLRASDDGFHDSDALAPARGILIAFALGIALNTVIAAGLYDYWTLSQSVARGSAFPTIPHAETRR